MIYEGLIFTYQGNNYVLNHNIVPGTGREQQAKQSLYHGAYFLPGTKV